MRFFRWVGVHPISVVLVIAATIGVMLVLNSDEDSPRVLRAPAPSATPGPVRTISEADLAGWSHSGKGRFEATEKDGQVQYTSLGGPGALWFEEELGDFALTLQFRIDEPGGDSGVYVRLQSPDDAATLEDGVEIQISSEGPGEESTGAIFQRENPRVFFTPVPGQWHEMNVRTVGMQVLVSFDDIMVTQFPSTSDPDAADWSPTGYIALQNHSKADVVHFRNIRLIEL